MHFFEKLERDIDIQAEYEKLEKLFCCNTFGGTLSLQTRIELNFLDWKKRGNYTSLNEVREQLNLPYETYGRDYRYRKDIGINDFLLYCEMVYNLLNDFKELLSDKYSSRGVEYLDDNIQFNIEKLGFYAKTIDDNIIIVEKNAGAIKVADIVPEIADVIIEYNHFLLKGNIKRKKELLKIIADALEPKRKEYFSSSEKYNKESDDFFFLVNNFNIRHNNCDKSDSTKYCKVFDEMTESEKEKWYDYIYDQALLLFLLIDYSDRKDNIKDIKKIIRQNNNMVNDNE